MKIKALFLAVSIFGATFFVTSNTDNDKNNDTVKKQAVDMRKIKIPVNG
jgi:hypothetical protein